MKYVKTVGAAVLSGGLLMFAMPPFYYSWLGWIAFLPLFVAVASQGFLVGFIAGLIAGLTPAALLANGVVPTPYPLPGEPNWIYAGFAIFGALLGVMGGIVGEGKAFGLRKAVVYAAVAVLLEFASTWALPEHMALSQSQSSPCLFLASTTGIWGVSYWVWFTNLAAAASLKTPRRLAGLAVGWMLVAGGLKLGEGMSVARMPRDSVVAHVAVVQTDSQDLAVLRKLNERAAQRSAIAVWPELSALSIAPRGDTKALKALSKEQSQTAFVTSFEDDLERRPHNTAALFKDGSESARYFKRRPFSGELLIHTPGEQAVAANWNDRAIGLNICFDSCYPNIMRDTANLPTDVLFIALPTEDPPSRGAVVQSIHAAYTPFRAAELGITIARADITARSMIVGPWGQVLAELGTGEGVVTADVHQRRDTIYLRFGDWFVWMCSVIVSGAVFRAILRRRPKRSGDQDQADHAA